MNRIDLDGRSIEDSIFRAKCAECGMPTLSYREYHPYEACELFKKTHDGSVVWEVLRAKLSNEARDKALPVSSAAAREEGGAR